MCFGRIWMRSPCPIAWMRCARNWPIGLRCWAALGSANRLTRDIDDAEAELNDRVYALFHLTKDEIELLQREVEH
jgi:hypothetical protein